MQSETLLTVQKWPCQEDQAENLCHNPAIFCRMRDRGKQKVPPPKKARPGMNRKGQKKQQFEKPRQPQKQVIFVVVAGFDNHTQ